MRFDEDDPLVEVLSDLRYKFGTAFSADTTASSGAGVVEFNGLAQTEALDHIAEALWEVSRAIESAGSQIANAMMTIAREWEGSR